MRGSGLDSCNGPAFVQVRIALFAKVLGGLAFAFLVLAIALNASQRLSFVDFLTQPSSIAHISGLAVLVAVWLVCRSGRYPFWLLGVFDGGAIVASTGAWAMFVSPKIPDSIYWGVVSAVLTLLARAILVPSSAKRTLQLSLAAVAPLAVTIALWVRGSPAFQEGAVQPAFVTVAYQVLIVGAAVFMATMTSRVLYELRQKVREANEVGPYALEERLGSGGMGEVWRARHRFLIRAAAVKLIRPEVLSSGRVDPDLLFRRFEREARATAALRSPHTVQLYDFGQADDGSLFYVMEMLTGIDLEKLVARHGPVPAERAIHILRQICHSLADAHQNGLIHRDVKPANIFVSCAGTDIDFVKVLDFGLVRLSSERSESDGLKLTQEGTVGGTPAYVAPEIVLGEAYDHRVDIYGVGCVGYWLVTGKLVFEADTAMKVMLDHARSVPPRPQTRTELPVPPELEQILLDCLEKDPARRPASAADLAARLLAVPVPPWTTERASNWWRIHMPTELPDRSAADVLLAHEGVRELRRKGGDSR